MIRKRILGRYQRYKEKIAHHQKIAVVKRHTSLLHKGFTSGRHELPVACLVKNGMEHLPSFMNHYKGLGLKTLFLWIMGLQMALWTIW